MALTKYILHGGEAAIINTENDKFYQEILKTAPEKAKILLVYFAKEADRIPKNKAEDIDSFTRNNIGKDLSFEVAEEEKFIEQIKNSDIIFIHGGSTIKLMNSLKNFTDLNSLFTGKIVAGESAGANALSFCCYSPSADAVVEGLGIIPVKTIPHYKPGDEEKFKGIRPEIASLFLPEFKYKVFEVN